MDARDIRIWRMNHNLSLEELGKHLGKHRNTIWNWEHGAARVPVTLRADLKRVEDILAASQSSDDEMLRMRGKTFRRHIETGEWSNDPRTWTAEGLAGLRAQFKEDHPDLTYGAWSKK
jgi:transcriptional regulator with XRE-family HTH domain